MAADAGLRHAIVVKVLHFPVFCGVAGIALRRGRNVLCIFAIGGDVVVTAFAGFRGAFKHAAAMAGFTLRVGVRPQKREARGEVIERRGRFRRRRIRGKHAEDQRK